MTLTADPTPDAAVFAGATPEPTAGASASAAWGGGIYCNWKILMMRISKRSRISTERETITHVFMREKYYRMNSKLSTKNSTMPRRRIFMNACISKKRRTLTKNNEKLGTKTIKIFW